MRQDAAIVLNDVDALEWMRLARQGRFEAAWRLNDRIRRRTTFQDRSVPRHLQQVWDGRALLDQRVLIRCYHGLGDTIQFMRYVPLVKARAREVIVWLQPALIPLVRDGATSGIDRLVPLHDGTPDVEYDVDIEIMELPYAFRTTLATIPNHVPYLAAKPMELSGGRPRIGVVWRAGDWDTRRSLTFRQITILFETSTVSWHGVQFAPQLDEHHPRLHLINPHDVVHMAGAIQAMDLVISVDSMPAHLAGALGVPVWTLLAHDADWRWMVDRRDSPWYPTMRLFRQPAPGDWKSVLVEVREAIDDFSLEVESRKPAGASAPAAHRLRSRR